MAGQVCPFDSWFRTAEADYYSDVRWKGSRPLAIAAIRRALARDPNNAGLRRNLVGFLVEAGDKDEAVRQMHILLGLVPNFQIPLFVNVNPASN